MKVDFIIDGASVGAANGATYRRLDPVTGKVASEAAAASAADVDRVVEAAARAFPAWSETGPSQRRALLNKAADLLETRTAEFSQLMTEEIGSTGPWGGFNVFFAATLLREAAALTTQITGEVIPADKPGVLSMAIRQPVGVVDAHIVPGDLRHAPGHGGRAGGGMGPSFRREAPEYGDLSEAVLEGEDRGMPAYRNVSATDITNLSAYFKTLGTSSEPTFTRWWEATPSQ